MVTLDLAFRRVAASTTMRKRLKVYQRQIWLKVSRDTKFVIQAIQKNLISWIYKLRSNKSSDFDNEIQSITIEVLTERIHTEDVEPVDCEETESNQASLSIWVFVACIVIFAALLCLLIYLRIKERYFLSLRIQSSSLSWDLDQANGPLCIRTHLFFNNFC